MNHGGFSWKRALGITSAKRKISRATGIPLTRSGRQRKVGKALMDGGCLINLIGMVIIIMVPIIALLVLK